MCLRHKARSSPLREKICSHPKRWCREGQDGPSPRPVSGPLSGRLEEKRRCFRRSAPFFRVSPPFCLRPAPVLSPPGFRSGGFFVLRPRPGLFLRSGGFFRGRGGVPLIPQAPASVPAPASPTSGRPSTSAPLPQAFRAVFPGPRTPRALRFPASPRFPGRFSGVLPLSSPLRRVFPVVRLLPPFRPVSGRSFFRGSGRFRGSVLLSKLT